MNKVCVIVTGFLLLQSAVIAAKTPSDVYSEAVYLDRLVELYKTAKGISESAKTPPVQVDKLPTHVYAKSLEVRNKIIRLQKSLGSTPLSVLDIPLDKKITPSDVYEHVSGLSHAIESLLTRENIRWELEKTECINKTPANVYEKLWETSFELDTLVGAINPNLVYAKTIKAKQELLEIAKTLQVSVPMQMPERRKASPLDVTIAGFRNMYSLAKIERRLSMKATRVSEFPIGKITPSEAYDTTNNILAEIARIKHKLGISEHSALESGVEGMTPSDVLVHMEFIGVVSNAILEHLGETNVEYS